MEEFTSSTHEESRRDSGAVTGSAREEARAAIERGWSPVPGLLGGSGSREQGWQDLRVTRDNFEEHFPDDNRNVVILTGEPSKNLVDVDVDDDAALRVADRFFPDTDCVSGRESRPSSHLFYYADVLPDGAKESFEAKNPQAKDDDPHGATIVEVRGTRAGTTAPGSVHKSGERVRWDRNGEPGTATLRDLLRGAALLATTTVVYRNYPSKGQRHDFGLALVGVLVDAGLDDREIELVIRTAAEMAGDDDPDDRVGGIESTRQRKEDGLPYTSWGTLRDALGDDAFQAVAGWLRKINPDGIKPTFQSVDDLFGHLQDGKAYHPATDTFWAPGVVRATIAPVTVGHDDDGKAIKIPPDLYLLKYRPINARTWVPGEPEIIENRVLGDEGWEPAKRTRLYNTYRPTTLLPGDPAKAFPWIMHVIRLYPEYADRIFDWFAFKAQNPTKKINFAIVFGGPQGIGKDTLIEPLKRVVGTRNTKNISPAKIVDRFNSQVKTLLLVVDEARDLGEITRRQIYERMKTVIAAPPRYLAVEVKHQEPEYFPNVCSVLYTTNHLADALYLPEEDRRHLVLWTDVRRVDLPDDYFEELYAELDDGGYEGVYAWLLERDLSGFSPYQDPPKTAAFYSMVTMFSTYEDEELGALLDELGYPSLVTRDRLVVAATERWRKVKKEHLALREMGIGGQESPLTEWLTNPGNAKYLSSKLLSFGYTTVLSTASNGKWRLDGSRPMIYGHRNLTPAERLKAAEALCKQGTQPQTLRELKRLDPEDEVENAA